MISVIMVTAGANDLWRDCLVSVSIQTHSRLQTIVIDNTSDPEFRFKVLSHSPSAVLYKGREALSYCAALNKGITLSKGEYILCLNDDVVLDKDFVRQAVEGFSASGAIGMVSGKILRTDKLTIDSTGLFLDFCRRAKERGYGQKDRGQFDKPGFIFGVNGAVAFYRKAMLDQLKEEDYFDPAFGFFYEDLDIAWRANRRGWIGYYLPQALAYHVRGATARNPQGAGKGFARKYLNDSLSRDLIRNRYLTIIKNESLAGFLLHFAGILVYDCIVWGYYFLRRPRLVRIFMKDLGCLKSAVIKRLKKR